MNREWFNLPNRITLARLAASIVLFVVLAYDDPRRYVSFSQTPPFTFVNPLGVVALVLFVLVAASDWLDGYLARKYGQVTTIGRILDPFVDKVAVCGTYIMLLRNDLILWSGLIDAWMVVVIVAREFFVNDSRGFFESKGISFAAEMPGKIKMTLQCISVSFLLFFVAFGDVLGIMREVNITLLWLAVIATVASGIFYMRKGMLLLRETDK